jgi:hypothetical protein
MLTQLASQLTQARVGLAFEPPDALAVALEGGAHLGDVGLGQSQELGFAVVAVGQSWGAVRLAAGTMAIGFAAFAAEADEGAAEDVGDSKGWVVHIICK